MNFVSILGLVVLLGLAWAMSYHRSKVSLRPIFWGLGLQFLLALIILREDEWSYVGMAALSLLVVAYLFRPEAGVPKVATPIALGASLAAGFGLYWLPGQALLGLLAVVLVALLINARWQFAPALGRYGGVVLIASGVAWLISQEVTGEVLFQNFSTQVAAVLNLSDYGAQFLFGNLSDPQHFDPTDSWPGFGFQFAFRVLPTMIFVGGLMGVFYYLGVMQKVMTGLSHFMRWTIRTSGAETLSCTSNVFIGQTESPLLIRPYLAGMTQSELLTVMVGGFATIAGGVLAGYIAFGVPAGHLIAASVMSAPAALVIGKIIYPETEHSQTAGDVELPEIEVGGNVIEAAATGITDGLKLAVNVGAMLLGFIALVAVIDVVLNWGDSIIDGRWLGGARVDYAASGFTPVTGEFDGWFPGSLQTVFGTILSPLAWLMGVPWADAGKVGNLLGVKIALNELVSYGSLGNYIRGGELSERAEIISTYALCGFANFSSIGIQIGGISALAPERRADLAKVGLKAMFGGALASWTTATIAGILL